MKTPMASVLDGAMIEIIFLHPKATPGHLGLLPFFLVADDPRPAREQFNERYEYGGWSPNIGWSFDPDTLRIRYPGDPPLPAIAECRLRDEHIIFYPHGIVAIVQKNGAFEIARMD